MLPGEIEPFGRAHYEALTTMLDELLVLKTKGGSVTDEDIARWYEIARGARFAVDRFQHCIADEVQQKQRLQERFRKQIYEEQLALAKSKQSKTT